MKKRPLFKSKQDGRYVGKNGGKNQKRKMK